MKLDDLKSRMETALDTLSEACSAEYAESQAHSDWMERKAKIVKADEFINAKGSSVAEREAMALVSAAYMKISDELKMAQTKALIQKAKREDAEIAVRVWQTIQANKRAPNV